MSLKQIKLNMKKLALFLSAVIFLSACSNKIGLQKRKYNKGFYVSTSKDKSSSEINKNNKVAKLDSKKVASVNNKNLNGNEIVVNPNPVYTSIHIENTKIAQPKSNHFNKSTIAKDLAVKGDALASAHMKNHETQRLHKTREFKAMPNAMASGGDTNLIVLVILCLFPFINLIAIYLKDSKKITLNFWLTLIFDLLFFIPGIIFALLVVLDVVNMA